MAGSKLPEIEAPDPRVRVDVVDGRSVLDLIDNDSKVEETDALPMISRVVVGEVVPIPTFPAK